MKRMSIAEQTLKKQVDNLKAQYKVLVGARDGFNIEMKTLSHVINGLENEIFSLESIRKHASLVSKP